MWGPLVGFLVREEEREEEKWLITRSSNERQAGRLATNMPTFISAEAQARIEPRFSRKRDWSFIPMRNFRRTMGAMDALVRHVSRESKGTIQ